MIKRCVSILLLFIAATQAEDIYVSQSGAGTQSGVNAANAHSLAWLNTAGNWGGSAGQVGPGDTVRLSGTFTSAVNVLGSGNAGNVITILFETGAKFTSPAWADTGAITVNGRNFITVDGGTNGLIECTANGTAFPNKLNSVGVRGYSASNFTVQNLTISNMYVRIRGTDRTVPAGAGVVNQATGAAITNYRVTNCTIHDAMTGIDSDYGAGCSNYMFDHNTIYNINWGGRCGNRDSDDTLTNLVVAYNRIYDFLNWNDDAGNVFHHNGFYAWSETPGTHITGIYFYGNIIGPNFGGAQGTSGLWAGGPNPGSTIGPRDVYIFKNVIYANENDSPGNAFLQTNTTPPGAINANFYYNTIIGGGVGSGFSGSTPGKTTTIRGNIITRCTAFLNNYGVGTLTLNNNLVYQLKSGQEYSFGSGSNAAFKTLAQVQAMGYELNTINANPLMNADGTLQAGSPAIGVGPNLTSLGIAELNTDINGNPRPATGNWTLGAFESAAVGPSAPVVSSSAINAAGTQFSMTFSEAIAIGAGGVGGVGLSSIGGAITLGSPSVGGVTITWPITNRLIGSGEAVTRFYAQPGNGIESQSTQLDVASFPATAVTNNSTVAQVAIPVFSPAPGAYSSTQNVTMTSSTLGAVIRYTTDTTDPTASSTIYTTPIPTSLSTTYKAKAFAAGFIDSPIATGAYQIGDFVIGSTWTNIAVPAQTGVFTWTFRATPSASPNNNVIALADHIATGYADLAVIARFAPTGAIDAFNGLTVSYTAVNPFPYTAGQAYDFVVSVNVVSHTYSMTVVQAGGSTPTTIATNYGFRGASVTAADLDVFAGLSAVGTATVSNMVFSSAATLSLTGMAIDNTGTQLTATFNSPPSFGTGGQSGFTVSAIGGAVTATQPNIVANSITWTTSRVIGRGESVSATYVQPGNGIEAASGGADLASFAGQNVLNNSSIDLTPPTPNPSTFSIVPAATDSSTITMTATTSTDAFSGPVQYFFNEISGNAGGSDSGWQSSPSFTNTGLAAGTQYTYRVQTRDAALNTTTFSGNFSATTAIALGARPATPGRSQRSNIVNP